MITVQIEWSWPMLNPHSDLPHFWQVSGWSFAADDDRRFVGTGLDEGLMGLVRCIIRGQS